MSSVRLGLLRPLGELAEAHDLDVGFLREVADQVDDTELRVHHAQARWMGEVIVCRAVRQTPLN